MKTTFQKSTFDSHREQFGYARCVNDFNHGVAVQSVNPYPADSPEHQGWQRAVSDIAKQLRKECKQ